MNGTLGYAGSYHRRRPARRKPATRERPAGRLAVRLPQSGGSSGSGGQGQAAGTFTALPSAGQVVRQGQSAYSVNGLPVVAAVRVRPRVPQPVGGHERDRRAAAQRRSGRPRRCHRSELDPGSSYFSAATATALDKLQSSLGLTQTGTLPLGQVVFLPTALKVSSVSATLGAPAQPGAAVLQATSKTRQVTAQVDATQQPEVTPGARVSVVLPDGRTTPGVVTSVGTVAAAPSGNGSGSSSSDNSNSSGSSGSSGSTAATINVGIQLSDPAAAGTLDQAPVAGHHHDRHRARRPRRAGRRPPGAAEPGYAVEVAGRTAPVTSSRCHSGLFDDADGLVQVTGRACRPGQQVVVPQL